MKFLVDAQIPRRIANRTLDTAILQIAAFEGRVVDTKDSDFVDSFILIRKPEKLLLISTGNITNAALEAMRLPNLPAIVSALIDNDLVELTRTSLIIQFLRIEDTRAAD